MVTLLKIQWNQFKISCSSWKQERGQLCKDSNWPNEPLVPALLPGYWAQILQGSTTFYFQFAKAVWNDIGKGCLLCRERKPVKILFWKMPFCISYGWSGIVPTANLKTKVFLQVDEWGGIISVQQMRQYVNSDVLWTFPMTLCRMAHWIQQLRCQRREVGGGGVAFNAIKQQDAVTSGTLAHLNWELIPSTKNIKSLHIQSKDEVDDVKCILLW